LAIHGEYEHCHIAGSMPEYPSLFIKTNPLFIYQYEINLPLSSLTVNLGMIFVNHPYDQHDLMLIDRIMYHRNRQIAALLLLLCMTCSCITVTKPFSVIEEDKLYVTRIFVGNYLDYQHTASDANGNPDLIWITTTQDSIHGKISAYSKECSFSPGERLFLRRVLTTTGRSQAWVYQVENSDTVSYKINEYQNHNNILVETLFNTTPYNALPSDAGKRVLNISLGME
jgi:hypothetical protein